MHVIKNKVSLEAYSAETISDVINMLSHMTKLDSRKERLESYREIVEMLSRRVVVEHEIITITFAPDPTTSLDALLDEIKEKLEDEAAEKTDPPT